MKNRLGSLLQFSSCASQLGNIPRKVLLPRLNRNPSIAAPKRPLEVSSYPRGKHIQMGDYSTTPPEEAPFPLNDTDKWVLSLTDEEYTYHTWDDLKRIIDTNDLATLKRKPSDLRRYLKWTAETKVEYGSMMEYLLVHRLPKVWGRAPFTPVSSVPFAEPSDYRVLMNDWPYGFVPGITHIVVWSRTPIPTDPETGDLTAEARKTIEDFVKRYFVDAIGPGGEEKVMWFKNWAALQSVRALEHFHVLVRDVEPSLLQEWTKEQEFHRSQQ